jgi:hypothetical protein
MALSPILRKSLHALLPVQGQTKKYSTPNAPFGKTSRYFISNPEPGKNRNTPANSTSTLATGGKSFFVSR